MRTEDVVIERTPFGVRANVPQRMCLHSPTGWEYGYGGSGPSDLALNVLLEFVEEAEARRLYQRFKWDHIATLDNAVDRHVIRADVIRAWVGQFAGAAVNGRG